MSTINPILRIFNKNYNNAIPFEIRQELGLETGDLLSYSITAAGDVLIHKIPVDDSVPQEACADGTSGLDDLVIKLFNSLTADQQSAAISYLTVNFKDGQKKGKKTR